MNDEIRFDYPRKYMRDPLEYHISKSHSIHNLEITQEVQKSNLITWAMNISHRLSITINKFLTVLLSIDETFYANLPMPFNRNQGHP